MSGSLIRLAKTLAAANLRIIADALQPEVAETPAPALTVVRDPASTTAATTTTATAVRYGRLGFGPPPRDVC